MPLLLDTDYAELKERGLSYLEDETQRFFILPDYPLPNGFYHERSCDVLVIIPQGYNQAGIDMLWTNPHLTRIDGKVIPRMELPGGKHKCTYDGREFCRWSRHWNHSPVVWRAGTDNVVTILHRIAWAFNNPDAKQ